MWIRIEQIAIRLGLFAALLELVSHTFPEEIRPFFFGDGLGTVFIGWALIAAMIGTLLLLVNLILRRFEEWPLRLMMALFFWMGFATVVAFNIT